MSATRNFQFLRVLTNRSSRCLFSSKGDSGTEAPKETAATPPPPPPPAKPAQEPAAPNTVSNNYQCNEYYRHDEMSFYDIDAAMANKRVGQPSSKTK